MESIVSLFSRSSCSSKTFKEREHLKFFIHDVEHTVKTSEISPDMTLNDYLRKTAHLTGTKNMCFEGGCGACIVAVSFADPITERTRILAVNSCLVPLYKMSDVKIFVVDQIGNQATGYHPIQKAMVQFSGTQCGYCTPGMLMNMYALYESGEFKMEDVENSFGGNICRCTGYRPILTAFRSLASDASQVLIGSYADIEDLPVCKTDKRKCHEKCQISLPKEQPTYFQNDNAQWYKASSINQIFDILRTTANQVQVPYMLVGGNTATGVYRRPKDIELFIDVSQVPNLLEHTIVDDKLIIGANTTLTDTLNLFRKMSKEHLNFIYLDKLADHIDLVANVPVRNTGTLAGNLMTKHDHHEFPSDIFLILETVGAVLNIVGIDGNEEFKYLTDFLSFDMNNQVIKSITILPLDAKYHYESYKICPRVQNAHALVNAGFLFRLTKKTNKVKYARIVYGSISHTFVHAKQSEKYLCGKQLFDNSTLQGVFEILDQEIVPHDNLPDPSPQFRKQLAISLFYKFVLSITPDELISPKNKSGGIKLQRPISTSSQDYDTKESLYPLTKPIPKLEALAQCSGEAEYIMDKPDLPNQHFAAFVLAKAPANSIIVKIDPTNALAYPGVVKFFDHTDVPGENNFMPKNGFFLNSVPEELFCSGVVKFYFQPIGLIVATSQKAAEEGAELVAVSYDEGKNKPLLTIRDLIAKKAEDKIIPSGKHPATKKGTDIKHTIKGTFDISWQYHYHMETQCCMAVPIEDGGIDLFAATQDINQAQSAAAIVLNIPINKVNVTVRRLGGAYGGKITRCLPVSCATALAAYKLKKPVKFAMTFEANMNVCGKRFPFTADYEAQVDAKGKIQSLTASMYTDCGAEGGNENISPIFLHEFTATYNAESWDLSLFFTKSDNHTGTYCRAPASTESLALNETIMQHIATETGLDPIQVRLANANPSEFEKYLKDLVEWAEVDRRKEGVILFNKANRWIKRGIAVVPMLYSFLMFGNHYALVSVFQGDGSVSITHGAIEMGQGINTKAAQACAHALGIPLEQISVKPTQGHISPNNFTTGGSAASEGVCNAVLEACKILKERMKPVKDKMPNATWQELVRACYFVNVDLAVSFMHSGGVFPDLRAYPIYGATCAEVEVDILTGTTVVRRVDLIEDAGDSMSPLVDIGQVEGAFVMGMGYWTSEQLVFDEQGQLLTNRTWTYKPPGAKDIPVDFRVKFPKNNPNPLGILNSKATGEPPLCMAFVIPLAIRDAVGSARQDSNPENKKWYPIRGPSTVENTFLESLNDYKQYKL